jgi:hypothetical protein
MVETPKRMRRTIQIGPNISHSFTDEIVTWHLGGGGEPESIFAILKNFPGQGRLFRASEADGKNPPKKT